MLRVGLTGGVGSGKSKAADMLSALGAYVSRSDEIGRALMQRGQPVMQAIAAHFGPSVMTGTGALDRVALAKIAFQDGRLEELNALVHPAVIEEQVRWMNTVAEANPEAVAVVESALIFETKHGEMKHGDIWRSAVPAAESPWRTRFDRIVVVTAPEAVRRARYIARVSASDVAIEPQAAAEDFERRAGAQWTDPQKTTLADYVVQNNGSIADLQARVESLYLGLRQEAKDRLNEAM